MPAPRPIPEQDPTPREAASTVVPLPAAWRRLGISERAGRVLIATAQLPYVAVTARRRGILESDLIAFVQARRRFAAPPPPLPSIAPCDKAHLDAHLLSLLAPKRRRGA